MSKDISHGQKNAIMKNRRRRERLFQLLFCASFYDADDLDEMTECFIGGMRTHFMNEVYKEDIYVGREGDVTFCGGDVSAASALFKYEAGGQPRQNDVAGDTSLKETFFDVMNRLNDIDKSLSEHTSGWSLERMGKAELTILRLALYEMHYGKRLPAGVAINEALELAKIYASEDSAPFINGVLAKFTTKEFGATPIEKSKGNSENKALKGHAKILDVAKSPVKFPPHGFTKAAISEYKHNE